MNKKIALVTGGSRGLGKEMARALAAKGLDVIITYNTGVDAANAVAAEIEATGTLCGVLQLDMSDIASLQGFVNNVATLLASKWNTDKIDYLINNAGIGATIPMAQVTEDKFDELLNIHYKGVYFLTQKLLPLTNDHGGIVFISSGTTRFCVPGYSVYASLKGAIEVLSKYVAKEYGVRGIRSNVVAPGPIETDFNNAAIRNNPQMKAALSGLSPLGRVGAADDVGGVVAFLCTDDAKWVNNQRIEVSGGINS